MDRDERINRDRSEAQMDARRVGGNNNQQQQVPGYIDCGKDESGKQIVVFLPGCLVIDVRPAESIGGEIVALTLPTKELILGITHSKVFLERIGLRNPSTPLYVPEPKFRG